MELLGKYTIERLDIENYEVTFEIPDNSNYNLRSNPGSYDVEIQLNNGETQPSSNYQSYKFTATEDRGEILVQFIQQDYTASPPTSRTKPVIRIHI